MLIALTREQTPPTASPEASLAHSTASPERSTVRAPSSSSAPSGHRTFTVVPPAPSTANPHRINSASLACRFRHPFCHWAVFPRWLRARPRPITQRLVERRVAAPARFHLRDHLVREVRRPQPLDQIVVQFRVLTAPEHGGTPQRVWVAFNHFRNAKRRSTSSTSSTPLPTRTTPSRCDTRWLSTTARLMRPTQSSTTTGPARSGESVHARLDQRVSARLADRPDR